MSELDLSKAKARAVEESIGYVGECVCDEAWTSRKLVDPTCGWHLIEGLAEDIVDATLPHILEALAEQAEPFVDQTAEWLRYLAKSSPTP